MPLSFIIGGCGCGKTSECIKRIAELEKTAKSIIYIVPQQFTLETERLLLDASEGGAIMKTRVLSFRRLSYVLMNGSESRPMLSALGRAFVVRRIAYEHKDELEYFSKVVDKQGFLDSLINLITEFYQYNITPDKLLEAYRDTDPNDSLSLKLKDLYTIYSAYRSYIEESYIASEEALSLLCGRLKDSEHIKNSHIFIDMMDYFIPQEYDVIRSLLLNSKSVTVALNGSFGSLSFGSFSVFDPYFETKRTVNRLLDMATECKTGVENNVFLHESKRHAEHPDFLYLQKNYFYTKAQPCPDAPENIHIVCAPDTDRELDAVCRRITALVRSENMRYDDIAVIIDASYHTALKNKFDAYGIPVFIDSSRPVAQHPLTGLILSVLDILCFGVNTKNMLKYAKNAFSPISDEDVCLLENYVLKHGLDGYAWGKKEWRYGFSSPESENCLRINAAKNACMDGLAPLLDGIKRDKPYTARYITDKIYDFIFALGTDKKLAEMCEKAESDGDLNAYRRHSRIWDELVRIFETMVGISDRESDISEFSTVLRSGLDLCSISVIPPTQDNIIIGDIDRSRLPQIKALFMLGVNEGIIPPYTDDIGIFGDRERTLLTEKYFEMSADNLHKINLIDMNIYTLLLKPEKYLYLSYTAFNGGGKRAVRSSVISRLLKLFPHIKTESAVFDDMPPAPLPAFEKMLEDIRGYRDGGTPSKRLYNSYLWFRENAEYAQRLKMLKAVANDELAKPENANMQLMQASAEKLYGTDLSGSVSKLEKYADCPFAYFLDYGLHIREREEYEFDAIHLGNVFHSVLEGFSNSLAEQGKDWRLLDKGEISDTVEKCVDDMIPNAFNDFIAADPQFSYTMKRIKKVMSHSINALCGHVRAGTFQPAEFEVGFGIGKALPPIVFALDDGKRIILNGKIDRVDILESDGDSYVKIIDYKSGTRDFSREQLYYGMQLQLILYMDSYIKTNKAAAGKNLLPGGVFYFKVSDPLVEKNNAAADIEKLIMEQYEMNGLVLNESTVLEAIGEVTPPKTKNGRAKIETLKSAQTADRAAFEKMCGDAEKIACILGRDIL
ncbi:MAG: PD-(D/E)XK nuclease family protein, partial [Firmicutes bacterium]|nr:PD-(D/E)XK nuclease family protein [Bacillota bacterium]